VGCFHWTSPIAKPARPAQSRGAVQPHTRRGHCGRCTGHGVVATNEWVDSHQLRKQEGVTENVLDKHKGTKAPPFSVSTMRWLRWWCAMMTAAAGELWLSVTTLAVLYSSKRRVGQLGAG
jgi:hypothetical protein